MDTELTEQMIRVKLSVILENPLVKLFTMRISNSEYMLKYLPELLMIVYNNPRGKEILKETQILEFLVS